MDMDDAASAFAWELARRFPDSAQYEYASALVPTDNGYGYSTPRTSRDPFGFKVSLPANYKGLIHNHPKAAMDRKGGYGDKFTQQDIGTQRDIGVPSYIVTPSGSVLKREGKTETEILGLIPLDEIRKRYLAEGLKK